MRSYQEKHVLSGKDMAKLVTGKAAADWYSRAMSHGVGILENLDAIAAVCETSSAYLYCGIRAETMVTVEQVRAMIAASTKPAEFTTTDLTLDDLEHQIRGRTVRPPPSSHRT
jgi:hypothetical protein